MTNPLTCSHCGAVQSRPDATACSACGLRIGTASELAPEARAALFAEVSRRAREQAWHAHVPANRFVERQHRALRTALVLVSSTLIVLLPAAVLLNRAAQARFEMGGEHDGLLGTLLLAFVAICLLLSGGALYIAYRILRSFLAYRRAPIERCAAIVVTKRRMPLGKPGGKEVDFVTLEFSNGEQREYRADKAAFESAVERGCGLAYLRANHLLELKLLSA